MNRVLFRNTFFASKCNLMSHLGGIWLTNLKILLQSANTEGYVRFNVKSCVFIEVDFYTVNVCFYEIRSNYTPHHRIPNFISYSKWKNTNIVCKCILIFHWEKITHSYKYLIFQTLNVYYSHLMCLQRKRYYGLFTSSNFSWV